MARSIYRSDLNLNQDKIRILTAIVQRMAINACKWGPIDPVMTSGVYTTSAGLMGEEVKVGDLIVCQSSGIHDYTVGFATKVEKINGWTHVFIRELGTNRICDMSNEGYYVVHGLFEEQLLEGLKYNFCQIIKKTFGKYGDGIRLYGGVDFIDDVWAEVTVREKFGIHSQPFKIKMQWNRKKISMKTLAAELEAGGWFTTPFTSKPLPPTQGDQIFMTIGPNFVSTMTVKGEQDATHNDEK